MMRFVELTVFCLAVSGVVGNYAEPPKIEVKRAPPKSTQRIEGVYSDTQTGGIVQAPPCHHIRSEANQMDPNPAQSDVHLVHSKDSLYRTAPSAQRENFKEPINYENRFNDNHQTHSSPNTAQPSHNSAIQYKSPNSEYKDAAYVTKSPSQANGNAENRRNAASSQNADAARVNNVVHTENLAKAVIAAKAADQIRRSRFDSDNSHPHFDYPTPRKNLANDAYQHGNTDNVPNQYHSQNHVPAVAQLNVANQYKNVLSPNELHEDNIDDQQHNLLIAKLKSDDNRRAVKTEDYDPKNQNEIKEDEFAQNCQPSLKKTQSNDEDNDYRREQELYKFINHKPNEDYQEKSGKGNHNKANQPAKSQNSDDLDDQSYHDEFEAYSPPGQRNYPNKVSINQRAFNLENVKPVNDDDIDEKYSSVLDRKGTQQLKKSQAKKNNANVDQPENSVNVSQSNQMHKNRSAPGKQGQPGTEANKNNNEKQADEEGVDKHNSDEDYLEDYKYDLSDPQSRRSYTPQRDQNKPQADCDSEEEAQNKLAVHQKEPNSEVEEVYVTATSGRRQKVLVGEHTRVCYACSSASNPTCSNPTRLTTVKYCHRGHDSCITKVFKANGIDILTRDCGTTCNDNIIPGVTPKYNQCSVCHSDLCNGAFSLNSQNVFFICALAVVTLTKYFM